MVVLHYTAMQSAQAAIDRLCDPEAEVSAHYVIGRDGQVTQLVDEADRAWHAGAGQWGWVEDVNSHSIGIELDNPGPYAPFPAIQMQQLVALLAGILARHDIPPERVIGHSDMAPGRKQDPGPCFDWKRLADAGLSVWATPAQMEADWASFKASAFYFGYRVAENTDDAWNTLLAAFRLRFRPGVDGPLDGVDTGIMARLGLRYPCQAVDLGLYRAVD